MAKINKSKCLTDFCRKKSKDHSKYCHSCILKKYKEKNPVKYTFCVLKNNAKRRGKDFSITFEEFEEFCVKSNYIAGKGRKSESYHIDRIDENKGYSIDNIQILTNKANVVKYLEYSIDELGKPDYFKIKTVKNNEKTDEDVF